MKHIHEMTIEELKAILKVFEDNKIIFDAIEYIGEIETIKSLIKNYKK
jgi:hypothetical protein